MKKNLYYLLFLLIIIGIGVRLFNFGANPSGLYWDEQAILADAKSIATTGLDVHSKSWFSPLFASYGDYKLPVYIWSVAIAGKIVGWNAVAVRLPNLLSGLAAIWIISDLGVLLLSKFGYKFNRESSKFFGLVVMAVVASSPWAIHFSRVGFEAHLGQFWLILSWWIWLKFEKHNWKYLALPFGVLATYTYFSVRFVWLGVLAILWLMSLAQNLLKGKQKLELSFVRKAFAISLPFLIMTLLYLICLWPMMRSPFYAASNQFRLSTPSILNSTDYALESNQLREMAGNSSLDRIIFHRHLLLARNLLNNLSHQLDFNFMFLSGDQNLRHSTGQHGLYVWLLMPFLIWGLIQTFKLKSELALFLVGWWMLSNLPAIVPLSVPHSLRSLNALAPLSILIGIGVWKFLASEIKIYFKWFFLVGWILLTLEYGFFLHTVYPKLSSWDWQSGFGEMSQQIYDQSKTTTNTVWVDPFDDRLFLWFWTLVPVSDLQALPKTNFQTKNIDNLDFGGIRWQEVVESDLVFGPSEYINSEVQKLNKQIENVAVFNINGQKYLLGEIKNE